MQMYRVVPITKREYGLYSGQYTFNLYFETKFTETNVHRLTFLTVPLSTVKGVLFVWCLFFKQKHT